MAATAGAIRAGRAFVELFADDSKLTAGLRAATGKLKEWGRHIRIVGYAMEAAGAAMLAPLMASVKTFMSAGDQLDKMATRVGASVEFLSALGHAASLGGTSIDEMELGIRRLQRTAMDANRGLSTSIIAFQELGISVLGADGKLKPTEKLFLDTAAALSKIENNTKKAALATMVFGRSGTSLLPMLREGAEGLHAAMEEAHRLGIVLSTEDATAAAKLQDAWTRLTHGFKHAMIEVGAALAPALQAAADAMVEFVRPVLDFIRNNRHLIVAIGNAAMKLVTLGAIVIGIGWSFTIAANAVTILAGAVVTVASLLGLILSPLSLTLAAIGGIAHYSGIAGQAVEWLGGRFAELGRFSKQVFQGIADALIAGDIQLAVDVLWAGLDVAWRTGKASLLDVWLDFRFGMAEAFEELLAGLKIAWAQFGGWFAKQVLSLQEMVVKTLGIIPEGVFAAMGATGMGLVISDMKKAAQVAPLARIGIDAAVRARESEIGGELAASLGMMRAERGRRGAGAGEALALARQRLADAIEAARKARVAAGLGGMAAARPPGEMGPFDPNDFAGAMQKGLTVGTFSKFALGGLGMGGPAEETARNTREMRGQLKSIRQVLHRGFNFGKPVASVFAE